MSALNAVRVTLRSIGEVLITLGLIVLLFVAWQMFYVTAVESNRQDGVVAALEDTFAVPAPTPTPTSTGVPVMKTRPPQGEAMAILRVPRLGPKWAKPVFEGTDLATLRKGLGRYEGSALPGALGNLAMAGHRTGHGNTLIDLDDVKIGDVIVVETREGYFVYRAKRWSVVEPWRVDVVAPVPEKPGVDPTKRWLTITTCTPLYISTHRYVVFALFDDYIPRSQGLPRDLMADPDKAA